MEVLPNLLGVGLGGALALIGSSLAQRQAAKARASEAARARVEKFRRVLSDAVGATDVALSKMVTHGLGVPAGIPYDVDAVLEPMHVQCDEARRILLRTIVAVPAGATPRLTEALEALREDVDVARRAVAQFVIEYCTTQKDPQEAGVFVATEAHDAATDTLARLVALARGGLLEAGDS